METVHDIAKRPHYLFNPIVERVVCQLPVPPIGVLQAWTRNLFVHLNPQRVQVPFEVAVAPLRQGIDVADEAVGVGLKQVTQLWIHVNHSLD